MIRQQRGFTVVELVVVVGMVAILVTVATLQFSQMQQKAAVEKQVRDIYATLNQVRMEALYTKTPRAAKINGSQLLVYATDDTTVPPKMKLDLAFPMVSNAAPPAVTFDAGGMMLNTPVSVFAACIRPGNSPSTVGNIDSVVVSAARLYMGKTQSGGACDPDHIDQK